jgi:hypothetical protein
MSWAAKGGASQIELMAMSGHATGTITSRQLKGHETTAL